LNTNQKSCERKENVCNMMMLMILCNYTYIEVIMMAISNYNRNPNTNRPRKWIFKTIQLILTCALIMT